ncbi:DUF3159 domain-containing protein [Streptomyces sp. NPDC127033]|uniref:DUF3159 domain-containing protein n=1 Tax=Streptomyces sp. NPDC127033 TaxID=3347110 RepID=UPI0036494E2B
MPLVDNSRDRVPEPGTAPATTQPSATAKPTALESMGGPMGFVYSTVPVVIFVAANAFLPLPLTVSVALATGLALTVFRLTRGERFSSAVGSLVGIAITAGVVAWTGSAKDFFVIGIWAAFAGFLVTFCSAVARRPLTGIMWNLLHGGKHAWRDDRTVLRAHDVATLAAATVFGARFVVMQWLYLKDSTGWLAAAKIIMGAPLTALAAVVVIWAFRQSTKRLAKAG